MPRTQIQASGSLGARTAILAPDESPEARSALAIRQDSSPASREGVGGGALDVRDAVGVGPPAAVKESDHAHCGSPVL